MLKKGLGFLFLLAGCSAQGVDPVEATFLAHLNNTSWGAGGSGGINTSVAGLNIKTISVHEAGKKVIVNAEPSSGGTLTMFTFLLESVRDANSGYFTNTIRPEPGTEIAITRFVGLKVSGGNLYWENHNPPPTIADFPAIGSDQAAWDAFNRKWWTRDKVAFTSDFAILGKVN